MQFSDTPPAMGAVKAFAIQDDPAAEANSTTNVNSDNQQQPTDKHRVVMYSATWCSVCKKAKKWFAEQGIRYREYDIENNAKGRRDYKKLKGRGVPIILLDGSRLNGFSSKSFMKLYQRDS